MNSKNPGGKKIDLEKVLCDFKECHYLGDMSDCYMSSYTICRHYLIHEYFLQNQKKEKYKRDNRL